MKIQDLFIAIGIPAGLFEKIIITNHNTKSCFHSINAQQQAYKIQH